MAAGFRSRIFKGGTRRGRVRARPGARSATGALARPLDASALASFSPDARSLLPRFAERRAYGAGGDNRMTAQPTSG
jgi:hypothetical protein